MKIISISNISDCIPLKLYLKKYLNINYIKLKELIRKNEIKLNNHKLKDPNDVLLLGSTITIYNKEIINYCQPKNNHENLSSEVRKLKNETKDVSHLSYIENDLKKYFKSLVLLETNCFYLINKPSNIASQGGTKIKFSLDQMAYLYNKNITSNLVHRLDKPVSGLMFIAKNYNFTKAFGDVQRYQNDNLDNKSSFNNSTLNDINEINNRSNKKLIEKIYLLICQNIPNFIISLIYKIKGIDIQTNSKVNKSQNYNYSNVLKSCFNNFITIYSSEDCTNYILEFETFYFTSETMDYVVIKNSNKHLLNKTDKDNKSVYSLKGEFIFDYIIIKNSIYNVDNIEDLIKNFHVINNNNFDNKDIYSVIRYKLITGKKHQIRQHMSRCIMSPIINDNKYLYDKSKSPAIYNNNIFEYSNTKKTFHNNKENNTFEDKYNINKFNFSIFLHSMFVSLDTQVLFDIFDSKNIDINFKNINKNKISYFYNKQNKNIYFKLNNLPSRFSNFFDMYKINYNI